jgi:hypothetical protein
MRKIFFICPSKYKEVSGWARETCVNARSAGESSRLAEILAPSVDGTSMTDDLVVVLPRKRGLPKRASEYTTAREGVATLSRGKDCSLK